MRARRIATWIAAALFLLTCGFGLLVGREFRRVARLAAGVTAKQLCSCIFVDGSAEAVCRSDLPPGYDPVQAAVDRERRTVRAWLPMLAARAATYRDGSGCTLQR
jgi:hypothetical protein